MTQQEKYNKRSLAQIATLRPDFGNRVRQWLDECRSQGLNPLVYMAARSVEVQQHLRNLYLQGKGPLAAEPRKSYHCYGRAIDWVNIVKTEGKDSDLAWKDIAALQKGIQIARDFKLHSIGAMDLVHLQDGTYTSWRDLPPEELISE